MNIIMFTGTLVWNLWYDPTEHHTYRKEGRGAREGKGGGIIHE